MHAGAPIRGCYQNFANGSMRQVLEFLVACSSEHVQLLRRLMDTWTDENRVQTTADTALLLSVMKEVVRLRDVRQDVAMRHLAIQYGGLVDLALLMCEGSLRLGEPIMFDEL